MHGLAQDISPRFSAIVRAEDAVIHTPIACADAILVLGNRMRGASVLLARRAADLYCNGLAPRIIVSGGVTNDEGRMEAEHIRYALRALGVPAAAIAVERHSTNTKENIAFSRTIATRMKDFPRRPKIIVVGQRFASKRVLMTMAAQWPEATAMLAPVCMMGKPMNKWHEHPWALHTVAREVEKMPEYCAKGDLAPVDFARHNRILAVLKARSAHPRPKRT